MFLSLLGNKPLGKGKTQAMVKQRYYQNRVLWMLLTFSGNKTLSSTLYIETEQHYQKLVLWVLFTLICRKMRKFMQIILYVITTRHYEKGVLWVFFRFFVPKPLPKRYEKRIFFFPCLISNCRNAYYKHTIWKKRTTFPETCLRSVYERVMHEKR